MRVPPFGACVAQAFPALYDWVSYPITILIEEIYELEMVNIQNNVKPCPFRLELLASLERLLCFCHTGNAAVFATSLMAPLNLSRSAVADGFPTMSRLFNQSNLRAAVKFGLQIDPRRWPTTKEGYPAVASKRAQVLTYSLPHFMVRATTFLSFDRRSVCPPYCASIR